MSAPRELVHTADLYKPFGAASATWTGEPCRVVPSLFKGRGGYIASNYINWSHYVDFNVTNNSRQIRDGASRAAGADLIAWAMGDELRCHTGEGDSLLKLAVVWVEWRYFAEPRDYLRVYCLRDDLAWTTL